MSGVDINRAYSINECCCQSEFSWACSCTELVFGYAEYIFGVVASTPDHLCEKA